MRPPPLARPAPLLLLAALLLAPALGGVAPRGPAQAEELEETERRLKSARVDADLRQAIRAAIRRGVAWLRSRQDRRGSFHGQAGHTALAGLALRHAAIPAGVEGGRHAIAWLAGAGRRAVLEECYAAGLTALLLLADRAEPRLAREIHERLSRGAVVSAGYWGYGTVGGAGPPNLSTSQFAALGLWAAEGLGAPADARSWRMHLELLIRAQRDDGSWGYVPPDAPLGQREGYPTGTFMGLANLVLAERALEAALRGGAADDLARARIARAKGLAALRRHARWWHTDPARVSPLGPFPYYGLYALEKACVFLDLEEVGGLAWYPAGARWLLARQAPDGGWGAGVWQAERGAPGRGGPPGAQATGTSQVVETAFALLFLLRVSESYRPTTPRPVDPPPATTPREAGPAPVPPAAPALAPALLEDLARRTQGHRIRDLAGLLDRVEALGRALGPSSVGPPDDAAAGALRRRAEDRLLDLAGRFRGMPAGDRTPWQAVSFAALEALVHGGPRVGPPLMDLVRETVPDASLPPSLRFGWYSAALETLRRLDPPGLRTFLVGVGLDPDPEHLDRTAAAIVTLAARAGADRRVGREVARALPERLAPLLRRSAGHPPTAALFRDLTALVSALAADAADVPALAGADPQADLTAALAWLRRHAAPDDPLWR